MNPRGVESKTQRLWQSKLFPNFGIFDNDIIITSKKKISMSADSSVYSELKDNFSCEKIISLDHSIRFVGVCSTGGLLLDSKYRDDTHPLLSDDMLKKSIKKSALRHVSRGENIGDIGRPLYSITSYENVKRATIPLDDELLLLVSFERNEDEVKIIKKILDNIHKD